MGEQIQCPVRKGAIEYPDRVALTDGRDQLTYRDLDRAVDDCLEFLNKKDVAAGDVVAVLGKNSIRYAILLFASFRSGFLLMPINFRLTPSDWRQQLDEANCRLILYDAEFETEIDDMPVSGMPINAIAALKAMEKKTSGSRESYLIPGDREALIIHTSGTTGRTRGVVLTWSNLFYSALGLQETIPLRENDNWLAALGFFHIGGISIPFRTAHAGCTSYIADSFEPEKIIELVGQRKISHLSVVPTMLDDLINKDEKNSLWRLKTIILGGAPADISLLNRVVERKLPVMTTYGMTETSAMVTLHEAKVNLDTMTTAGKLLPYRQLMIADENGLSVTEGITGKILVRGKTVFKRYLGADQKPKPTNNGWFDTGDFGQLNKDGLLTVLGRTDDIILSGGEKIDLNQIDRVINSLEGIKAVAIASRPDGKWGRRPIAFVEIANEYLTEFSIKRFLEKKLPKIMIPDRIVVVEALPLTGSGKCDHRVLYDQFRDIFTT